LDDGPPCLAAAVGPPPIVGWVLASKDVPQRPRHVKPLKGGVPGLKSKNPECLLRRAGSKHRFAPAHLLIMNGSGACPLMSEPVRSALCDCGRLRRSRPLYRRRDLFCVLRRRRVLPRGRRPSYSARRACRHASSLSTSTAVDAVPVDNTVGIVLAVSSNRTRARRAIIFPPPF
jgi:hypothetical protein